MLEFVVGLYLGGGFFNTVSKYAVLRTIGPKEFLTDMFVWPRELYQLVVKTK